MRYNEKGELIITMSDGSEINAGKPSGSENAKKPVLTISGYKAVRKADYGTTITFHCTASFIPDGYEIHWFVNGEDKGTGKSFTVPDAREDYFVFARLMKDGSTLCETEIEKVDVDTSFFGIIIAFFKKLFNQNAFIIDQK